MISTFENLTDAVGKSIEPCFSNKRQLVKCIVDRDSPAVEIVNAFTLLIPDVLASEEQGLLIAADIHRLVEKDNSRELRLHITTSLAKAALKDGVESAERLASLTRFLQQLATMIILIVKPPDLKDFTALLDVIERSAPDLRFAPDAAFLVATYVQAIVSSLERTNSESTAWIALLLKSPFACLERQLLAQIARSTARRLIQTKDFDAASKLLCTWSAQDSDARVDLLIYLTALANADWELAITHLKRACSANNMSPQLLVWAGHQANEYNAEDVFAFILVKLVNAAQEDGPIDGVDALTAARLLFRLTLERVLSSPHENEEQAFPPLFSCLETILNIARIAVDGDELPKDFARGLAWVRMSALEVCSNMATNWNPSSVARFFEIVALIVELEQSISNADPELVSIMHACRIASITVEATRLRKLASQDQERLRGYETIVSNLGDQRSELLQDEKSYQGHQIEADLARYLEVSKLLEAEAQIALGQWHSLRTLVEDTLASGSPQLLLLRLIADKVATTPECPYEVLRYIFGKTLAHLYSSHALDSAQLAIWLRLMIVTLLEREPKDAFQYLENAKQLVQDNLLTYPAEELSWLISTAWDQGIEIYSACRPDDPALDGLEWCLIAFELANLSSDHMLAHQLGGWIDKLKQGRVARSNDSQLHEETAPGAEDDVFMDQTS